MIRITEKKLSGWTKEIAESVKIDQKINKDFFDYYQYVFDTCLTDDDITQLRAHDKSIFNFSKLRPFVLHGLKGVKDSMPTVSYTSANDNEYNDHPNLSNEEIADLINEEKERIFDLSHFPSLTYKVAKDQYIGGKGIFKVCTDYINDYDFEQTFFIEHVENPTLVYFDGNAKHPTKKDAQWCAEKIPIPEKKFKKMFPNVDVEKIIRGANTSSIVDFEWTGTAYSSTKERLIYVIEYYFIQSNKTKVYLTENGKIVKEEPESGNYRTRSLKDNEIWRIRYCGTEVLEKPHITPFKDLPFVMVPAESRVNKDGKLIYIPYAKHGFDAMRSKNFMLNYYMSRVLNNPEPALRVAQGAMTKSLEIAGRAPQDGNMQIWQESVTDTALGQTTQMPPIVDVPSPPLPNELLQAAEEMDNSLAGIFGTQFPSLDDLNNVSGKALYNLAQYMSASTEILMQNILEGIMQVGEIIKNGMPQLTQPRIIPMTHTATQQQKNLMFDYRFSTSRYQVAGHRGVSTQLQKEANFENLIGLSKTVPSFGAFLEMPQVMEQLLEMLDLQNEPKWMKLWEEWQQQQQEQQQQQSQAQAQSPAVPPLDPQLIAIQTLKAHADLMSAQAKMKEAETRAQTADINSQNNEHSQMIDEARLNEDQRKTNLQAHLDNDKLIKDYTIDTAKLNQKHTNDLLNHARTQNARTPL